MRREASVIADDEPSIGIVAAFMRPYAHFSPHRAFMVAQAGLLGIIERLRCEAD